MKLDDACFDHSSVDKNNRQDVPPFHVAAGNPARVIRKIDTKMDPEQDLMTTGQDVEGAEVPMAELAKKLEGQV